MTGRRSGPGEKALERVADWIEAEGEPLALLPESRRGRDNRFGVLAAAGSKSAADPARFAFVVEAIREGYLCHYGNPRLVAVPDPDLGLLAGDLLYAAGLSELAELGDATAVGILSQLIRTAADLQVAGRPDDAEHLWVFEIARVACGNIVGHDRLVAAFTAPDPAASDELLDAAAAAATSGGAAGEFRLLSPVRASSTPGNGERRNAGLPG